MTLVLEAQSPLSAIVYAPDTCPSTPTTRLPASGDFVRIG